MENEETGFISKCCEVEMKVDSSDEGTSNYICTKCNKPCNFIKNSQITPRKILLKKFPTNEYICLPIPDSEYPKFVEAMEEYTTCKVQEEKSKSEEFAEWLDTEGWTQLKGKGQWQNIGSSKVPKKEVKTTSELRKIFEQLNHNNE